MLIPDDELQVLEDPLSRSEIVFAQKILEVVLKYSYACNSLDDRMTIISMKDIDVSQSTPDTVQRMHDQ